MYLEDTSNVGGICSAVAASVRIYRLEEVRGMSGALGGTAMVYCNGRGC